ncbi:ABC transporter ATP-binding protein, partial [Striga asiatica]
MISKAFIMDLIEFQEAAAAFGLLHPGFRFYDNYQPIGCINRILTKIMFKTLAGVLMGQTSSLSSAREPQKLGDMQILTSKPSTKLPPETPQPSMDLLRHLWDLSQDARLLSDLCHRQFSRTPSRRSKHSPRPTPLLQVTEPMGTLTRSCAWLLTMDILLGIYLDPNQPPH